MDLVAIYECFSDKTRLRILNLLSHGPLCVCHFQEILREPQVKISKHLAYLKRNGVVQAERCANWMVYRLPAKPPAQLNSNLACLRDCVRDDRVFREDGARLKKVLASFGKHAPGGIQGMHACC